MPAYVKRIDLDLPPYATSLLAAAAVTAVVAYQVLHLPDPPKAKPDYSLAVVDAKSPHWTVYPPDFYPGGAYTQLPQGRMRYWLFGPENGKKIVLVNGIMTPSLIWDPTARGLAEKGYRVLAYDLYGRGYSDAPDVPYNTSLYTTQLALLMQHVGWSSACVAGVSMGGGIAAAFTASFPHLVSSVALLCPGGLLQNSDLPFPARVLANGSLSGAMRALSSFQTPAPENKMAVVGHAQLRYLPGFTRAIGSSFREGPVRGHAHKFAQLGQLAHQKKARVLVVWGTADNSIPFRYCVKVRELIPDAQFIEIPDAPHDLPYTNPKEVIGALDQFFKDA